MVLQKNLSKVQKKIDNFSQKHFLKNNNETKKQQQTKQRLKINFTK